jgi:prepilin-type N-terminal cleavage/methylation domain-containing protein
VAIKRAFTLIELMIVVTIIIFLASIMVPRMHKYFAKAKQAEVALMLTSLHTAQQIYWAEHGSYTTKLSGPDSIEWIKSTCSWKPNKNFHYTYGFYFPGAQKNVHYFVGKLGTPPQALGSCYAEQDKFVARAAGKISGNKIDVWEIDEERNIAQS